MKAYVETLSEPRNKYGAVIQQDNQFFHIGQGDKGHCDFLVRMFVVALTNHDAAVAQMAERLPCKQDVGSSTLSSGSKLKFTVPTTSWGQSVTSVWSGDAHV
jgi:hypothetical protein